MKRTFAGIVLALLLTRGVAAQAPHLEKTIALTGTAVRYTAISPAGNFVAAVCSDEKLRLWEISSGTLVRTLDLGGQKIPSVHFSGTGRLLAAGGRSGLIRVWEVASGRLAREFTSAGEVVAMAFSPDDELLAAAPLEEAAEVWELSSGKKISSVKAPFSGTSAVAFSPDSLWLATADGDTNVRVYDARTGARRSIAEDLLMEPLAIAYSSDGQFIFTGGGDKTINVIDPASGKVLRTLPKQADALVDLHPSKDGKSLAAVYLNADNPAKPAEVLIWDLATQSPRLHFLDPAAVANGGEFLIDGRWLMTSGAEKEMKVWSAR